MNEAQRQALTALCERFGTTLNKEDFRPVFDLPSDWVAGGVKDENGTGRLYVGCDPEGRISSVPPQLVRYADEEMPDYLDNHAGM